MRSVPTTIAALVLALATAGCAITRVETSGPTDPVTEVEVPDASTPPTSGPAEAQIAGRLVERAPGVISVDVVRVLSGQEAVDAAHEDGELPAEESSLPNDVYIDDLGIREQHDVDRRRHHRADRLRDRWLPARERSTPPRSSPARSTRPTAARPRCWSSTSTPRVVSPPSARSTSRRGGFRRPVGRSCHTPELVFDP